MKVGTVVFFAMVAFLSQAGDLAAQEAELPDGVTEAMLSSGEQLFRSTGLCFACHAQDGSGMPGAGPDLTDADWLQIDGSYQQIIELVLRGVPADKAKSGAFMLPKGGSQLTEEQVKAVAAYVWRISHDKS